MPRMKISPKGLPREFEELVRLFPPAAIHDEVGYQNTQEMIDVLTSVPKLSKGQMRYLETLSVLFEAYEDETEAEYFDAKSISPLDMLKFMMEQHDMSVSDLGRLLGERSLGSKILSGQRQLSKAHIRKLADHFGVAADLFL